MKHFQLFLVSLSLLFITQIGLGQEQYSECQGAYLVQDPSDWCSSTNFFNNVNVSTSGYGPASCWTEADSDLWLKFIPTKTTINITVNGQGEDGTFLRPQVALYEGTCGGIISELACDSDDEIQGVVNIFETNLIIGQTYYIRINGRNSKVGQFSVCVRNYNQPIEPGQDCNTGSILCDKSPFVVQAVTGNGALPDEAQGSCLAPEGSPSEDQSTWFKWTAANNGTFTMIISPLQPSDDIDWALYEIIDGECTNKELIRCVATSCEGPTGLDLTSEDLEEDYNCDPGEDGFVKYVDMEAGKSYALIVNNFSNTGIGFDIEFGGTVEFLGPVADFEYSPAEPTCDEEFVITDQSYFPTGLGEIKSWAWSFGEGAIPQTATGPGPHTITYDRFGQKYITLEVTSVQGCIVTKIVPLFTKACCADEEAVSLDVTSIEHMYCPDIPSGSFEVEATGGTPFYLYSFENGDYTPIANWDNLYDGQYFVKAYDLKGCSDSIIVNIDPPTDFSIDAGEDQEVDLGYSADVLATIYPSDLDLEIVWMPGDDLSCVDCLDPTIYPKMTTNYVVKAIRGDGCMVLDSITIRVNDKRPIYSPNVFSPNGDGRNDFFTIFSGLAGKSIDVLNVFDRWGNLMYAGENLEINEEKMGWDGRYKNKFVDPGVYVWMANVRFLDDKVITYSGTITVVR